jgi:hypothetical protein
VQLNASDRFADAVERGVAGEIERQQRRGFGEPVPDGDLPAESLKFHRQFRIERRTTGKQQAHLRPELSMKRSKQDFAYAHSKAPT